MARPVEGERKGPPRTLRLFESDDAYLTQALGQGPDGKFAIPMADYMREVFNSHRGRVPVVLQSGMSAADKEAMFKLASAVNRVGNNMNQLAHRANAAHAANQISEELYDDLLYRLELIEAHLERMTK